jgi:hypothetical protein
MRGSSEMRDSKATILGMLEAQKKSGKFPRKLATQTTPSAEAKDFNLNTTTTMPVQDYDNTGSKRRYFKLNAKSGEIVENVKEEDGYKNYPRKRVEGKFKMIDLKEKEFEGKKTEYINLCLDDDDGEQYVVTTSWSGLGRAMINCLYGEIKAGKKLTKISVSIWNTITKSGKPANYLSLWNNGEKCEWAYGLDEQKTMTETITNKKGEFVSADHGEYVNVLRGHIEAINTNNPNMEVENDQLFGEETPIVDGIKAKQQEDNDDLPF